MSEVELDKSPYAIKVFNYLLTDTREKREAVKQALKQTNVKGKMPTFFWRHTLFSPTPCFINYKDGYTFFIGRNNKAGMQSIEEVMHFDYIMSNMVYSNGKLVFRANKEELVSNIGIDYKTFLIAFSELYVFVASLGKEHHFSIFDFCHCDEEGNIYAQLSDTASLLYVIDYLTETKRTRNIFETMREYDKGKHERIALKFIPVLRNMLVRTQTNTTKPIPLDERYYDKAGIVFDTADRASFKNMLSNRNSTENAHKMLGLGLQFNPVANSFSIDRINYKAPSNPIVFTNNMQQKIEQIEAKAKESVLIDIWTKRISKELGITKEQLLAQALDSEDILSSCTNKTKSSSTKNSRDMVKQTNQGHLNFEELEYSKQFDEVFDRHSLPIFEEERGKIFEEFKIIYQDLQEKKRNSDKYKDAQRCLSHFLKTSYAINTGDAKNITFTDKMEKIGENNGLSENETKLEFEKFRKYHMEENNSRSSWVSSWNTWAKNVNRRKENGGTHESRSTQYEMKIALENAYQIQKKIDEEIRRLIEKSSYSVSDYIKGKIEDANIGTHKVVIPPTIGRGTEMLFRFKDPKKQKVFEDRLWSMMLRREESITAQDDNSIDVKVIE